MAKQVSASDLLQNGLGNFVAPKPKPKPANTKPNPQPVVPAQGFGSNGAVSASTLLANGTGNVTAPVKAKTFTDGAGNVRLIGGKIVKAAPRRTVSRSGVTASVRAVSVAPKGGARRTAPAGATASGITQITGGPAKPKGAAKKAAAAPVDPIKAMVDDIIKGMNAPLDNQSRQLDEQTRGNVSQNNRLADFYDGQVSGIRANTNTDLQARIAQAAQLKGISSDTLAKNAEYLHSLMSSSNGGTQDAATSAAAQASQSDLAGVNDQMAKGLTDRGTLYDQTMSQLQVAGRAGQTEANYQAQLQKTAAQRDIDAQKAQNQAGAGAMYQQFAGEAADRDLKARIAESEFGLKAGQASSLDAYRNGQLGIAQQNADTALYNATKPQTLKTPAAAKIPASMQPGRFGNIPAKYDAAIDKVRAQLTAPRKDNPKTDDKDESKVCNPWRTAWDSLTDSAGLSPNAAALLASQWYRNSVTTSNPYNIRQMLIRRKVTAPVQRKIITEAFGDGGWSQSAKKPSAPSLIDDTLSGIGKVFG